MVQRNNMERISDYVDEDKQDRMDRERAQETGLREAMRCTTVMTTGDTMGRTTTVSAKSVSCTLCSFEITFWSRKLAKRILNNHQQRKHMSQETHSKTHSKIGVYRNFAVEAPGRKIITRRTSRYSSQWTQMKDRSA